MNKLGRHPHWKENQAIKKYILGRYTIRNDLSEPGALYFSAAFRLSHAQQEALHWWDSPPSFPRLYIHDFLPHTDASGTRDFQTMRQEKTLALAQALQCCAERLGVPTRVLYHAAWELQKCMALLMSLNGNDIVEASLLEPMGNKFRTPHSRGGSCPPGGGSGATRDSRSYYIPPGMSGNSCAQGNYQVD